MVCLVDGQVIGRSVFVICFFFGKHAGDGNLYNKAKVTALLHQGCIPLLGSSMQHLEYVTQKHCCL